MLESYHLERFAEDGLEYFLTKQGQKVAAITTILKIVAQYRELTLYGWKNQRKLIKWREYIGEEVAEQIRREACMRGTELHQRIANYLCGGRGTQWPKELLPFGNSVKPFLLKVKPIEDVKLVESIVIHPKLQYAGKVDAIVKWCGVWSLVEWKTANRPQRHEWIEQYILQSAAYLAAANKTYNLNSRQSLIVIAIPDQEAQVFLVNWDELQTYFRKWLCYVKFFWALQECIDIRTGEQLKLVTMIHSDGSKDLKLL